MSGNWKQLTLAGAVAVLFLSVGCGTRGGGDGLQNNPPSGPASGLGSGSTGGSTTGSTGLTGGATGTSTVNTAFPVTAATGLTKAEMLPVNSLTGASNAPTRLDRGDFGAIGNRPVVVQGNGLGPAQGRVTLMTRNPDTTTPGNGNIVLAPNTGTQTNLTDPFGVLVSGSSIFVTDNTRSSNSGAIVRFDNIQASGICSENRISNNNMQCPIHMVQDGNFLYVAEYRARGSGGKISRIDLSNNNNLTNTATFISDVNFPSSMVLDTTNGRKLLYITENGNNAASGAQGGVVQVDLNTFVAGSGVTTAGNPSTGVVFITPQTGDPAYVNPWDLAIDDVGNIAVTEGLLYDVAGLSFSATPSQGKIRVIAKATAATTPTTSRLVLTGLAATRGVSILREDAAGTIDTIFFVEGVQGLTSSVRQLTFNAADGSIFRHLQLDSGQLNPLDTLFDPGSTAAPVVAANLKYTVSFLGGTQGHVIDIR